MSKVPENKPKDEEKKPVKRLTQVEVMHIEKFDVDKTLLLTKAELALTQKSLMQSQIETHKVKIEKLAIEANMKTREAIGIKSQVDDRRSEYNRFFEGLKRKHGIPEKEGFSWNEETHEINPQEPEEET